MHLTSCYLNNISLFFNVHGSVHRKNILIYVQQYATLHSLFYLETALHVTGGTSTHHQERKRLYLQHLVFVTSLLLPAAIAAGRRCQAQCAWQHLPSTRPTTFHVWKTRGCQCSFRLLVMGGVSPETCWGSYKYGIINFDTLLHLVGFFFMNSTMMHGSTNIKEICSQHHVPVSLPPGGKPPVPNEQKCWRASNSVPTPWRREKRLYLSGIRSFSP